VFGMTIHAVPRRIAAKLTMGIDLQAVKQETGCPRTEGQISIMLSNGHPEKIPDRRLA